MEFTRNCEWRFQTGLKQSEYFVLSRYCIRVCALSQRIRVYKETSTKMNYYTDPGPLLIVIVIAEIVAYFICLEAISLICYNKLVPALEVLCLKTKMNETVAGAILSSFVTSIPILVISIFSLIDSQHIDFSLGSVIGCGVTAFTIIPGLIGIATTDTVLLKRRPLGRDILFYIITLTVSCLMLWDGTVSLTDCILLLVIYIVYVLVCVISPFIRLWFLRRMETENMEDQNLSFVELNHISRKEQVGLINAIHLSPEESANNTGTTPLSEMTPDSESFDDREEHHEEAMKIYNRGGRIGHQLDLLIAKVYLNYKGVYMEKCFSCLHHWLYKLLLFPTEAIVNWITIDSGLGTKREKWFLPSILLCMIHTFVASCVLAYCTQHWAILVSKGHNQFTISAFFGVILIGFVGQSTTISQCLSLSKRGYGNMALSNILGSQIIVPLMWYICICLGLPWLIHILVTKENLPIYASFSLLRVVLLLALCIIIFTVLTLGACLLFRQHQCRLTKTKGWVLVTCYFVFFFSYLFYMIEYILW